MDIAAIISSKMKLSNKVCFDKGEGSLINTKTGKLKLGETVMKTLVF